MSIIIITSITINIEYDNYMSLNYLLKIQSIFRKKLKIFLVKIAKT